MINIIFDVFTSTIFDVILFGLFYFVLIYSFGIFFIKLLKQDTKDQSMIFVIVVGFISFFAVLQVVYTPLLYLNMPLDALSISMGIITAFIFIYNLIFNRDLLGHIKINTFQKIKNINIIAIIALFGILAHVGLAYIIDISELDTSYYNGAINSAVSTNTMFQYNAYNGLENNEINVRYAQSGYLMFIAASSKVLDIHPLVITKFALPVMHTLIMYVVYYKVGSILFDDKKNIPIFIIFVTIVYLFGAQTRYLPLENAFSKLDIGKVVMGNLFIPMFIYLFACERGYGDISIKTGFFIMAGFAAVCFSLSSAFVLPIFIFIIGLLEFVKNKNKVKTAFRYIAMVFPYLIFVSIYVLEYFHLILFSVG